jgi:hypothetical protein
MIIYRFFNWLLPSPLRWLTAACLIVFAIAGCSPPNANTLPRISDAVEVIPGIAKGQEFYSIIVLPDTQYYSKDHPEIFLSQTRWIAQNQDRLDIIGVAQTGDLANDADDLEQYEFADIAFDALGDSIPYGIAPGNHDQPTVLFNETFGLERFEGLSWYGGHFGTDNDNSYQLLEGDGVKMLLLDLEFDAAPEVISWAEAILDSHLDAIAVLNTHSALDTQGKLTSEGKSLYTLLEQAKNLRLVVCGHIHGESLANFNFGSRRVSILLADYQKFEMGGNGYLRILTFLPERKRLVVNTYSPWLGRYIEDDDSQFWINFP